MFLLICSVISLYRSGQSWGTYTQLRKLGTPLRIREAEKDLYEISYSPKSQRCFLIVNPFGNILWGCTTYLDEASVATIKHLGRIRAIAISHPHELYAYAKWALTFRCPVYINERDKNLVVHNTEFIETWDGEELAFCSQIKLIRLGGHFDGGAILHWMNNGLYQDGQGVIFCADMLQVGEDDQTVSSMRSYHNFIPISESDAQRILWKLASLEYERIYASGNNRDLLDNAKVLSNLSLEKYICAIHIRDEEKDDYRALAESYRPRPPIPTGILPIHSGQPGASGDQEVGSSRFLSKEDTEPRSQANVASDPVNVQHSIHQIFDALRGQNQ
ncbi:hypothetical protein Mapa_015183 [Marchantia paleacea]|nr:hypothetical protein Mapa_015183 [Marchantia paleacea]